MRRPLLVDHLTGEAAVSLRRLVPFLAIIPMGLAILRAWPARAQNPTLLSLDTGSNTTIQTGQTYVVSIRLDSAPNVWVVDAEISYDPALIYVMGTQVGLPVSEGPFFTSPEQTAIVRNSVEQPGTLLYTISLLAPADPVSGSGVVGTFKIFPLAAGTTHLQFAHAEITSVTFTGSGDSRVASEPQAVKFTPMLLELTITGDAATPPPEVTPTPPPTSPSSQGSGPVNVPQLEATLFNVTAGPRTPEAENPSGGAGQGLSLILLLGGGLVFVIVVGVIAWLVVRRRRWN